MYTQWPFYDGLTMSYVLPYIQMIKKEIGEDSKIFLVSQEKNLEKLQDSEPKAIIDALERQNIFLIPEVYYKLGLKKFLYLPINFLKLFVLLFTKKIHVIHTQAMSAGMIGCILSWLSGKKLIVDSYEPLAESMVEGNIWPENGLAFKTVKYFEKKQALRASYIIAATASMTDYAKKTYNIDLKNFYWKPACVDMNVFRYSEIDNKAIRDKYNLQNKVVGIYVGKFGSQYLEHEVFDFFMACIRHWGDRFRLLLLTSHTDDEIMGYCNKSGFPYDYVSKAFVPHSEVKRYLCAADFALTPVKPLPSKRYCTPIKDGEYWALGLPVVITENISDDSDIIDRHDIGVVIRKYTPQAFDAAVIKLDHVLKKPGIKKEITEYGIKYRGYAIAENVYKQIYGELSRSR